MDYLEYLTQYPEAYTGFIEPMNRTDNLFEFFEQQGLLKNVNDFFSIGCGYGDFEIKLAQATGAHFSLLEPAQLFVDRCQQRIAENGLQQQLQDLHVTPFEDYNAQQQFDLVLSIHSWYAFAYQQPILEKALSMVKTGGKLVINLAAKVSPVSDISALSQSGGINLTSDDLSAWATEAGFKHHYEVEHNLRPYQLYVQDKKFTQQGQDLIAFLLATPWPDIDKTMRENIMEFFVSKRQGEIIDIPSGTLIFER